MKKIISFIMILSVLVVALASCGCEHAWSDANCTTPKTCSACGETEGTALAHNYEGGICTDCNAHDPIHAATYAEALSLIAAESYEDARTVLGTLGTYMGADKMLDNFYYLPTAITQVNGDSSTNTTTVTYTFRTGSLKMVSTYSAGGKAVMELTYDENGKTTFLEVSDNSSSGGFAYEYDECGNLIQKVEDFYDEYERKIYRYTYDEAGKLIRTLTHRTDGSKSTEEYVYDEKGNLIEYTSVSGGAIVYTEEHVYDERGNEIRYIELTDGKVMYFVDYTYDEDGNLVKMVVPQSGGNSTYVYEYTYDDNGNKIKAVNKTVDPFYGTSENTVTDYTYDESGRLIKTIINYASGGKHVTVNQYDDNGNISKQTVTSSFGTSSTECTYKLIYIPFTPSEEAMVALDNILF